MLTTIERIEKRAEITAETTGKVALCVAGAYAIGVATAAVNTVWLASTPVRFGYHFVDKIRSGEFDYVK